MIMALASSPLNVNVRKLRTAFSIFMRMSTRIWTFQAVED